MGAVAERPRALRAASGLRRHLPHLLRLHAPGDPAGGADAACRSSTSSPTTRSSSARTARPTSRSSSSPRCAPFPAWWCCAPPTPTRRRRPGGSRSRARRARRRSPSRRQKLPVLGGSRRAAPTRGSRAAATCSPRRRGGRAGAAAARHRLGGRAGAGRPQSCSPARASRARVVEPALAGSSSPRSRGSYREAVLPPAINRAAGRRGGAPLGWDRWVGPGGETSSGMDRFGASAPLRGPRQALRLHPRERGDAGAGAGLRGTSSRAVCPTMRPSRLRPGIVGAACPRPPLPPTPSPAASGRARSPPAAPARRGSTAWRSRRRRGRRPPRRRGRRRAA